LILHRLSAGLVAMALSVALLAETGVVSAEFQEPAPTPEPTLTETPQPTVTSTSTPTETPEPTITPTVTVTEPMRFSYYTDWAAPYLDIDWRPNCKDKGRTNGFTIDWMGGFCVPGVITKESQYFDSPTDHYGLLSSYGPNVMEANVAYRGLNPREVDGVALMSCADIGKTVWLRLPGGPWKGPFVVVDCSGRNHLYYHEVALGLAVEIGYATAVEWGNVFRADRVDVHIGASPPSNWDGVFLPVWWVQNVLEFEPLRLAE
jgi:hypothetical protein